MQRWSGELVSKLECNNLEELATEKAKSRQLDHSLHIGNYEFGRALCDSGASINLMPLSVVKRLSLGELTPTTMTLQMADMSMGQP